MDAKKFVERRRCIKPIYYNNPIKCLLSYEGETILEHLSILPIADTDKLDEIVALRRAVAFLEDKLYDAVFDEQEKRAIESIVIDDDDVEMQILYPKPKICIKGENAVEESSSAATSDTVDHITDGRIPFQVNVSISSNLCAINIRVNNCTRVQQKMCHVFCLLIDFILRDIVQKIFFFHH